MTRYYEAVEINGLTKAKVYHYDPSGNHEIVDWLSPGSFPGAAEAEEAAVLWAEQQGIEVEMA